MRLMEGQTYQEIAGATGSSTATISRVNRLLGDVNSGLEMAAGRIKIGTVHTQVIGSNLKRAAGTRARFFKDQGNIFPGTAGMRNACFLFCLQVGSQIKQGRDLSGGKIKKLQEAFTFERIHKYHLKKKIELV